MRSEAVGQAGVVIILRVVFRDQFLFLFDSAIKTIWFQMVVLRVFFTPASIKLRSPCLGQVAETDPEDIGIFTAYSRWAWREARATARTVSVS